MEDCQKDVNNAGKIAVVVIEIWREMKIMQNGYSSEQDRVFSLDEFKQFERLNQNTNSRIPVFFCIDVSGSMGNMVGVFETRLSLLSKVMARLLDNMKRHPVLSERAVIGVVTYNNKAILQQPALDLGVLDIRKATSFVSANQTIFSLGLRRTLQAIDQYRDSVRRSDVETFTPIMIFMTDGQPVGDTNSEIEIVYKEIWSRIQKNDLYVFPIGISKQADMSYVYALTPEHQGYQIMNENDFSKVFAEIEKIVNDTPDTPYEEGVKMTEKASEQATTMDTGVGTSCDAGNIYEEFQNIIHNRIG